jgi:AcrR family transcriptional regulator
MADSPPQQRRLKGEARRVKVLEVALDAFGAKGFRGASLANIAAEVGISEPGVVHHFGSKRNLLFSLLEARHREDRKRIDDEEPSQGLAESLRRLALEHEADPRGIRLLAVLAAESLNPEHPTHEWFVERYRGIREVMTGRVADEQAAGRLPDDIDPSVLARLIIAVLDGLELQFLLDPEPAAVSEPLAAFLEQY